MSLKHYSFVFQPPDSKPNITNAQITSINNRLDHIIAAKYPEFSRSFVRKLIMLGSVYVNSKRVKIASKFLLPASKIEIYFNPQIKTQSGLSQTKEAQTKQLLSMSVLYEDADIISVNKPAGLPTQPTLDQDRDCLYSLVKKQFKLDYLGMHHRLDRDTSGVILFTKRKDKELNRNTADLFKNHALTKIYEAVVVGSVPLKIGEKLRIENFLAPVTKKGKAKKMGSVISGGQKAISIVKCLSKNTNRSHIEIEILTGRMHQIRVHLSEWGYPVLGDWLYGNARLAEQTSHAQESRFYLHAKSLEFLHPMTGVSLKIVAPSSDFTATKSTSSY